ncbi:MAG: hypothetical protein M3P70_14610 [Actinomycetota bacterium]|nr:hypothetical protein [Actinomycetota bacterium]
MKPWADLIAGEMLVEEPDELLWRQVHPTWVEDGIPTSQAFKPATADEDKPSVARSSVHTAEEAYRWHTETAERKSVGTWGVEVGECVIEARLRVVDDSRAQDAPPTRSPAHAYLDFRSHTKGEVKLAGAALLAAALRRGQVYAPPS